MSVHLHSTDGLVLQCAGASGTCVCENETTLYTDVTSHVMHIPLKKKGGGWTASPINRSPFQTALCSRPLRQLAAISCQDRTQQSSLPVSPLWSRVSHGSGSTSIRSVIDAVESLLPNRTHLIWKLFKACRCQSRATHMLGQPRLCFRG